MRKGKQPPLPGEDAKAIIKKGKPSPMPQNIEPMLATLVNEPVDEKGWLYEMKWDGYRAVSYLQNGSVDIRSRNNKPFNEKFYPLTNRCLTGI